MSGLKRATAARAAPGRRKRSSIPYASLLLVGVSVFAISAIAFFRVPLLPAMGQELRMSAPQLGLFTTVFALGRLAADIPSGRLADSTSPLRMLAGGAAILGFGSALLAAAQVPLWAIGAGFFLGVSSAMANTTGMIYFSTVLPPAQRGRALAAYSAAMLGGQSLGPAIGGAVATVASWRVASGTGAAAAGVVVVLMLLLKNRAVARSVGGVRRARTGERAANPLSAPQRAALYAVPFSNFALMGAMPHTLVPILGAGTFGLSAGAIGLALGIGGLCRFLGSFVGGVVSDRVSRKAALVPALVAQALGVSLFAFDASVAAWVAGIAVMSFGSFVSPVATTILADRTPASGLGRQLGPFRFVGDLGLVAGPITATWVFEHVGVPAVVFGIAALLLCVALATALVVPETRRAGLSAPRPVNSLLARIRGW